MSAAGGGSEPARPAVGAQQVLVVGGGPTGLAAANLLGAMGVRVLLIERNLTTSDEAKAISIDDESLRSLQLAGLDEAIYRIIVPGTGTKYYGRRGQPLVHARSGQPYRFGHPFKNAFAQPEFERALRCGLDRFPHVEQRFGTALVGLEQETDGVRGQMQVDDGPVESISADYLLACDGGRSVVRDLLTIPMTGRSFNDVWLVVDTLEDPHDQRYGMHHGDPSRPRVIVPGRDGRCRYEFALKPGEGEPGEPPPFALLQELIQPYRALAPHQVERAVSYRFHALLADRLRDGRCFLLGDAAHMMPPFAGQGLNSGLRDAVNLSWKVAEVLARRAEDRLLDTYERERRPHAQAMIDLSVRLGRIVMTTSLPRAVARDLVIHAVTRTSRGRRYLSEMRFRPPNHIRSGAVIRLDAAADQSLVGTLVHQPQVLCGSTHELVRLDQALGTGWSLLGIGVPEADWDCARMFAPPTAACVDVVLDDRSVPPRAGRTAIADADRSLDALFAGLRRQFVLIRPDRFIAAVFPAERAPDVAQALREMGLLAATNIETSSQRATSAPPPMPGPTLSDDESHHGPTGSSGTAARSTAAAVAGGARRSAGSESEPSPARPV